MDMLIGRRCRFFLSGYSSPLVYIGKLQHQKRKRSMMANFGGGLQRDRIYKPMAAESVPCLQRRKKYGSMMAVHAIVLQRSRIHRRMMATSGSSCHARNTIYCRFSIYIQTNPHLSNSDQWQDFSRLHTRICRCGIFRSDSASVLLLRDTNTR